MMFAPSTTSGANSVHQSALEGGCGMVLGADEEIETTGAAAALPTDELTEIASVKPLDAMATENTKWTQRTQVKKVAARRTTAQRHGGLRGCRALKSLLSGFLGALLPMSAGVL